MVCMFVADIDTLKQIDELLAQNNLALYVWSIVLCLWRLSAPPGTCPWSQIVFIRSSVSQSRSVCTVEALALRKKDSWSSQFLWKFKIHRKCFQRAATWSSYYENTIDRVHHEAIKNSLRFFDKKRGWSVQCVEKWHNETKIEVTPSTTSDKKKEGY